MANPVVRHFFCPDGVLCSDRGGGRRARVERRSFRSEPASVVGEKCGEPVGPERSAVVPLSETAAAIRIGDASGQTAVAARSAGTAGRGRSPLDRGMAAAAGTSTQLAHDPLWIAQRWWCSGSCQRHRMVSAGSSRTVGHVRTNRDLPDENREGASMPNNHQNNQKNNVAPQRRRRRVRKFDQRQRRWIWIWQ